MSKSWPEIKKLLDDPYVSADTKESLLVAYLIETGKPSPEAKSYTDKYKLDDNDVFGARTSVDDAYGKAKGESDQAGYHDRQVAKQVDQNTGQLAGLTTPTTSDEILDLAKPALAMFEVWVPIDAKVPGDSRGANAPLDVNRDIQTRFDEQRGINFTKLLDEADRLTKAHTTLDGLRTTTESQLNTLYQKWSGPAANASYEHYTKEIAPNVQELLPYLDKGPQVIATAVDAVFKACKSKADQVLKLYRQTVGSATSDIAGKVMKLANGDFNSQDQILEVAAWVDSVCGSHLESTIRADDCGLNDGNKKYTIEQCKKWIRESFNVEFWGDSGKMGIASQFKKICDDTVEAVDAAWQTMDDYLKGYQNQFTQPAAVTQPPPTQQPPPTYQPPPSQPPPSNPAVPTTPSASTPSTPATPSVPAVPTVPISGTHTDPAGVPDTPAVHPETISIKDGDREISVTSPDGHGHVSVTVDDGSGKPKTYDLDFGAGHPADPADPSLPTPSPGHPATDNPVPAGQDGKCVIHDGPLTITAERPPDEPDKVTLTVDDGTGAPATYTVDYSQDAQQTSAQGAQGQFSGTLDDGGAAGSAALPHQRHTDQHDHGEAGLAVASDQPGDGQSQQPQGAMAGGMPGMGAPGHGSGHDRGPARFAIAGDLFDTTDDAEGPSGSGFRISGSLDDEAGSVGRSIAREGS
jgi:uncharacterized protein YukE